MLDEHYSVEIALRLRTKGHDVVAVRQRAELRGASDRDLLEAAFVERRVLVTENVADFAPLARELVAAGRSHWGMVFTSPKSLPRSKATIGAYVRALGALLQSASGDDALVDQSGFLLDTHRRRAAPK